MFASEDSLPLRLWRCCLAAGERKRARSSVSTRSPKSSFARLSQQDCSALGTKAFAVHPARLATRGDRAFHLSFSAQLGRHLGFAELVPVFYDESERLVRFLTSNDREKLLDFRALSVWTTVRHRALPHLQRNFPHRRRARGKVFRRRRSRRRGALTTTSTVSRNATPLFMKLTRLAPRAQIFPR